MTTDAAARPRRRVALAVLAATTVAVGLVSRALPDGVPRDVLGDALYAVLIYLIAAFVVPRARWWLLMVVTVAVCTGIELFQLTGLPLGWTADVPAVSLVLGEEFSVRDIVVYAIAAVAASVVDLGVRTARARRG